MRASVILFVSYHAANAADFTWDGGGGDNKATTPTNCAADITPTSGGKTFEWNANSSIGTAIDWDLSAGFNLNNFAWAAGSSAFPFCGNNI